MYFKDINFNTYKPTFHKLDTQPTQTLNTHR